MKAILIICLAATQLVLGRATDSICSNMWQADFNNPDVSICPGLKKKTLKNYSFVLKIEV